MTDSPQSRKNGHPLILIVKGVLVDNPVKPAV